MSMTPKISPEQREALNHTDGPLAVEDEHSHRRYYLVDESTFTSLTQQEDRAAIREGIADMEAGRVAPLDEVMARIRTNLGLSKS
jgi:predicted transcriptional regulator